MILKLLIRNRAVTVSSDSQFYSGTKYIDQVQFDFDSEWEGYTKVARFFIVKDEKYDVPVIHDDDAIYLPNEVLKERGYITIGVIGSKTDPVTGKVRRLTSQAFTYKLTAGIAEFGDFDVPEADLWGQYADYMDDSLKHAEAIQKDVQDRQDDVIARQDDIIERQNDIIRRQEHIESIENNLEQIENHVEEMEDHVEQMEQNVSDMKDSVSDMLDEVTEDYEDFIPKYEDFIPKYQEVVTDYTDITENIYPDILEKSEQVTRDADFTAAAWEDIETRHENIQEIHEHIHQDHDCIHSDLEEYKEVHDEASDILYEIKNTLQGWEVLKEEVEFAADQAFRSEINARQSEINALDSELCVRDLHRHAHHDAKKAEYHQNQAEQAAKAAQFYAGFEMPEFYFDPETMSLYIKYPEQGCQLEFVMVDNELYWNFVGLGVSP